MTKTRQRRTTSASVLTFVELLESRLLLSVGSSGASQPPPTVVAAFHYNLHPQTLTFTFSEPVQSATAAAVAITNLTTGTAVAPAASDYDVNSNTLTLTFGSALPDATYQAVVSGAAIKDMAGQPLNGNSAALVGNDFVFGFFYLAGDVNHDGMTDFADLLTLAQHYSQSGGYGDGDLNGDGRVDFSDLLVLAQGYGHALSQAYTVLDLSPSGMSNLTAGGVAGGQEVAAGIGQATGGRYHALLLTGSPGSVVDLNPTNFAGSYGTNTDGMQQVGNGVTQNSQHALLWNGTATSAVDLNPDGFTFSNALGVRGGQQVGFATLAGGGIYHAMLWRGTAASAVDLNPAGFTVSAAADTSGQEQVGDGLINGSFHALLWHDTAGSFVDLNPDGYSHTQAFGVAAGQQVGYGYLADQPNFSHALIWSGTAASAVDVSPTGFAGSGANATNGIFQVGYAVTASQVFHAMLWKVTRASATDLQRFVPSALGNSVAASIDGQGDILGVAYNDSTQQHLVEWIPILPAAGGHEVPQQTKELAVAVPSVVSPLVPLAGPTGDDTSETMRRFVRQPLRRKPPAQSRP